MTRPRIEGYRIKGRATFDHDSYNYDVERYVNHLEDEILKLQKFKDAVMLASDTVQLAEIIRNRFKRK